MTKTFVSHDLNDLKHVAEWFATTFEKPVTVLLEGGMGAGKTTLIGAICAHLGADDMSSPTFSIVNEYTSTSGKTIFHFDLYRLEHTHQALDIGFEDYLQRDAYLFIEWPTVIRPLLDDFVEIRIADDDGVRTIVFTTHE
jgi:tRNA threonylcarbamoyladenosine biosynthesis protein TsaE